MTLIGSGVHGIGATPTWLLAAMAVVVMIGSASSSSVACSHLVASAKSIGQARPGHSDQAPKASKTPGIKNTQSLCSLKVTRKGKVLVRAVIVAPMPRLTSAMGSAQHTSVLALANRASQLTLDSRPVDESSDIRRDSRSNTQTSALARASR